MSNNKNHRDILDKLLGNIYEGEKKTAFLLRADTYQEGIDRIVTMYILPTITVLYAAILLLMFCIMYKKNMIGLFQAIFLLSNFCEVIFSVLLVPLIVVFFHIFDTSVPMPYPWCGLYYHLNGSARLYGHVIASYLYMLLGLNRICAVFVPFKMNHYFSRKRTIIYCSTIILVGILLGVSVRINLPTVIKKTWVDDLWGNNKMEFYTVCSLDDILNPSLRIPSIQSLELVFILLPTFGLIFLSIVIVIKLRRLVFQKGKLQEATSQNKKANRRVHAMNRIAAWVFLSCICTEFPLFIMKSYILLQNLSYFMFGLDGIESIELGTTADGIVGATFECLMPVNLILFIMLSKKLRKEIRECSKDTFNCKQIRKVKTSVTPNS